MHVICSNPFLLICFWKKKPIIVHEKDEISEKHLQDKSPQRNYMENLFVFFQSTQLQRTLSIHSPRARRGNRRGIVYKVVPPVPVARTRTSYEPSVSSPGRLTLDDVVLVVVFSQLDSPSFLHSTSNVWKSFLCSSVRTGRLIFTVLVPRPVEVSSTTRPRIQSGHTPGTVASLQRQWTKTRKELSDGNSNKHNLLYMYSRKADRDI